MHRIYSTRSVIPRLSKDRKGDLCPCGDNGRAAAAAERSATVNMSGRFVRSSKYRHVYGNPAKKEVSYDNVKVSNNVRERY